MRRRRRAAKGYASRSWRFTTRFGARSSKRANARSRNSWLPEPAKTTAIRFTRSIASPRRSSPPPHPLPLRRSSATTIAHGFATVVRFFPGAREVLGAIDDEVVDALVEPQPGRAASFEDQYACSGGQLYELIAGHDRFVADLRPLVKAHSLCCHPYDLCTELIAREAGVVVTDPAGRPLDAPLDVTSDVAWVGYANETLRRTIEPVLQAALRRRGLLT